MPLADYLSRNYLRKLLLTISCISTVLLLAAGIALYIVAERVVLNANRNANERVLDQIDYNIESMNELFRSLTISIYLDPEIVPLMTQPELRILDIYPRLQKLNRLADANPYVHSIVVYNPHDDALHATSRLQHRSELLSRVASRIHDSVVPNLALTPIRNSGGAENVRFFSYVLRGSVFGGERNHIVVLNVEPRWLLDNIRALNDIDTDDDGAMMIFDANDRLIRDQRSVPVESQVVREAADSFDRQAGARFSVRRLGGRRFVLSSLNLAPHDWVLVLLQPYASMMHDLEQLRANVLAVLSVLLALAVVLAVIVTRHLYWPVDRFVRSMKAWSEAENLDLAHDDEWETVKEIAEQKTRMLDRYRAEYEENQYVIHNYRLLEAISESHALDRASFDRLIDEEQLNIRRSGPYLIALVAVDSGESAEIMEAWREELAPADSTQNADHAAFYEMLQTTRTELLIVVSMPFRREAAYTDIATTMRRSAEAIGRSYDLPCTVAISGWIESFVSLSDGYSEAIDCLGYRFVYPDCRVLTVRDLQSNMANHDYQLPLTLEQQLRRHLSEGNRQQAIADVREIIVFVRGLNRHCMLQVIYQIVSVLRQATQLPRSLAMGGDSDSFDELSRNIAGETTLDGIEELFVDAISDLLPNVQAITTTDKAKLISDAVRKIIDTQYAEPALCLSSIASQLKLSPAHTGRLFREQESISVYEYINRVRLAHARTLLIESEDSIKEIMHEVGYRNSSYFWRIFKRSYGVTPKEFRLAHSINTAS